MRSTLSMVLAGLALTLVGVSTSNAADPVVNLTELPVTDAQGGGKVVTPKGNFDMKGHALNKIEIQAWNGANWVTIVGPTGMTAANNWTLNPSLPVIVGNSYRFRARMEWTHVPSGQAGAPVYSAPMDVTP